MARNPAIWRAAVVNWRYDRHHPLGLRRQQGTLKHVLDLGRRWTPHALVAASGTTPTPEWMHRDIALFFPAESAYERLSCFGAEREGFELAISPIHIFASVFDLSTSNYKY
jgi:hypothetical protein